MISKLSTIKNNLPLRAVLAPVIFEMCGIIPIVLVSLGILNIGAGVALRNTLVYQYSPVFFIISAVFFVYSIYVYLKKQNSCNLVGLRKHRFPIIKAIIFLTVLEGLILALLPFLEAKVYGKSQTLFSDFLTIGLFLIATLIGFIILTMFIKEER